MTAFDVMCLIYAIKYFIFKIYCIIVTYKVLHNEKDRPNRK